MVSPPAPVVCSTRVRAREGAAANDGSVAGPIADWVLADLLGQPTQRYASPLGPARAAGVAAAQFVAPPLGGTAMPAPRLLLLAALLAVAVRGGLAGCRVRLDIASSSLTFAGKNTLVRGTALGPLGAEPAR